MASTPRTGTRLPSAATWWKLLGAAGVASLVATGALTVRQERRRAAYTPDEIRQRLRERHAQAEADLAHREVLLEDVTQPTHTLKQRLDLWRQSQRPLLDLLRRW